MAWNHSQETQAVREGCMKPEELVLITKDVLGGRQAKARAEGKCAYIWVTNVK